MSIDFSTITINKLIIHEIYERKNKGEIIPPLLNNHLEDISSEASIETIKKRIIDALGTNSKCHEMEIINVGEHSTFQICDKMIYGRDNVFIANSKDLTNKLTSVQNSTGIPGGVLLFFKGKIGTDRKNIIGIIKAEIQDGYNRKLSSNSISMEFLNSLFLTNQQRLYKIGVFIELESRQNGNSSLRDNSEFTAYIYDHNISNKDLENAAVYFYDSFLGCSFASNDRKLTRDFYDNASDYFQGMEITNERKIDLKTALITYLKTDRSTSINVTDFANNYLEVNERDNFSSYMVEKGIPDHSFTKDLSLICNSLKTRKIYFSNRVEIKVPDGEINDLIEITENRQDETTLIKVKGKIIKS
jgi:hypothetical protein